MKDTMICDICPNKCNISEGKTGRCRARTFDGKKILPLNYGKITAAALDPIEKKPLRRYRPGSMIFSVGSFGCNLTCPFCQNHRISMTDRAHAIYKELNPYQLLDAVSSIDLSSDQSADHYSSSKKSGNIGIAFTYNEPLIGYEYVLESARLFKNAGMDVVLVSNGYICEAPLLELLPYVDAMNIDLKAFNNDFYKSIGGDLETVKNTIRLSSEKCHVEVTTLIIPGENDSPAEMKEEAKWLASISKDIPLHISRFFPAFDYACKKATDVRSIYELTDMARSCLNYVYTGNC